jgi:hypothetical protein
MKGKSKLWKVLERYRASPEVCATYRYETEKVVI